MNRGGHGHQSRLSYYKHRNSGRHRASLRSIDFALLLSRWRIVSLLQSSDLRRFSASASDEADQFYARRHREARARRELHNGAPGLCAAFSGRSSFFYYGVPEQWLKGDPGVAQPPPPERRNGRNSEWTHLYNRDVVSMPDTVGVFPWYAAWDLRLPHGSHGRRSIPPTQKRSSCCCCANGTCIRTGQIPAYEFAFGDVNPPVHAWPALRVYGRSPGSRTGSDDVAFSSNEFFRSFCLTSPGG